MGSGLWFMVCVPKEEYEKKLRLGLTSYGSSKSLRSKSSEQLDSTKASGNNGTVPASPVKLKLNQSNGQKSNASKTSLVTWNSTEESSSSAARSIELEQYLAKEDSLVKVLQEELDHLEIQDAVWTSSSDDKYHQVYFPCEAGGQSDFVLQHLTSRGLGRRDRSTIGVIPCAVFYRHDSTTTEPSSNQFTDTDDTDSDGSTNSPKASKAKNDIKRARKAFKSMQKRFLKTVTARLTVAQVVDGIRANAVLSFDFVMFIILASMIAALGLMENSSVVLVASMLISPLMGPILAGTFGAVIEDRSLRNQGLTNEIIGLSVCVVFGFLFGLICGNFSDTWGQGEWPTSEMAGRGYWRSLWVGLLIALPSGAGVALSVLGGNAGSLVGVAISASLLPPAVNAGILWALAVLKNLRSLSEKVITAEIAGNIYLTKPSLVPPRDYQIMYSFRMDRECAILGLISLLLTLVNILCIIIAAVCVLKIKEVAPYSTMNKTKRFWTEDVKIARNFYKVTPHPDSANLAEDFLHEWSKLTGLDGTEIFGNTRSARKTRQETVRGLVEDVQDDDVYQAVMQRVGGVRPESLSKRFSDSVSQVQGFPHGSSTVSVWDIENGFSDVTLRHPQRVVQPENKPPARLSKLFKWIPINPKVRLKYCT
ncbi:uncharacterized protein LOC106469415 [Limulus polyphemus]|uniref:Uncharacterized protein LOC106469415 n=1 Tax=Limulus polyphemus TaxID=6850 RepID=A0ABM1TCN3_LIMPO|nr:uncharacterized protein LOC106469415 [Limulus polyphemus]